MNNYQEIKKSLEKKFNEAMPIIQSLIKYGDIAIRNYKPLKLDEKDIDILFYGAMNEHRATVLNELRKRYNVVVIGDVFGGALDEFILRSKVLLNIHYFYECAMQEQARMIRWIGSPCRIISERSWKNYLNVEELEYKELLKL